MALIFGIAAALLLGSSDFWAGRATRSADATAVTRTVVLVSAVLSPLLLLVVDAQWIRRDVLLGALSGLFSTTALLLLYRGYSIARVGIVAPTTSVLLAAVPAVWDLIRGRQPTALGMVGMLLGLVALVLTSYTPAGTGSVWLGAAFGVSAGLAFGIAFTLMGEASPESGLVPVIVQRTESFVILAAIAPFAGGAFLVADSTARRASAAAGALAITAIACLQLGFRSGDSGPVAVASSQFATVAVVLSVLFNGERLRSWQAAGVALTAVAVALLAVGT